MFAAPIGRNQLRPACTMIVNSGRLTTAIAPKFGSSCLYCDGSVGGPAIAYNVVSPGVGDFTEECWIYTGVTQLGSIVEQPYFGITLNIDTSMRIGCGQSNGSYQAVRSSPISTNTWTCIAATRQSGTLRLFINGSLVSTATFTTDLSQNSGGTGTYIGSSLGNSPYTGYMDELRISTIARYTASYTPATVPFVNDQYTQVLCHFDNIGISNLSITDDNT